jgi:RAT1-interacting protein
VIIGYRDDAGIVKALETFETLKIPRLVREQRHWDPNVCINFADFFLTWLSESLPEDSETCYRVSCSGGRIELTDGNSSSDYSFIPDWFKPASEHD